MDRCRSSTPRTASAVRPGSRTAAERRVVRRGVARGRCGSGEAAGGSARRSRGDGVGNSSESFLLRNGGDPRQAGSTTSMNGKHRKSAPLRVAKRRTPARSSVAAKAVSRIRFRPSWCFVINSRTRGTTSGVGATRLVSAACHTGSSRFRAVSIVNGDVKRFASVTTWRNSQHTCCTSTICPPGRRISPATRVAAATWPGADATSQGIRTLVSRARLTARTSRRPALRGRTAAASARGRPAARRGATGLRAGAR